jgi:A/G-specific adenine glycosylase
MANIEWIEETATRLSETDLRPLVDRDLAVEIARARDLGIDHPSDRVDAFIAGLGPLFRWFSTAHRDFPWRRTRDPWAVIVAEILLQRTHATKVAEVYQTFHDRFADPAAVHEASREEVFETVEPLGFGNKKTQTLKALAAAVELQHDGTVPNDLEALQALPRIGPYTARACLCFAFGDPLALVDANVATVAEHTLRYDSPRRAHKDDALYALLDALIPDEPDGARVFNLAILDTRPLVCDREPDDRVCPFGETCSEASL